MQINLYLLHTNIDIRLIPDQTSIDGPRLLYSVLVRAVELVFIGAEFNLSLECKMNGFKLLVKVLNMQLKLEKNVLYNRKSTCFLFVSTFLSS